MGNTPASLLKDFEEKGSVAEVSGGCRENTTDFSSSEKFVKSVYKNVCKVFYRDIYLCWFR